MARHIELELNESGTQIKDIPTVILDGVFQRKVDFKIRDNRIKSFRIKGKESNVCDPFISEPNQDQGEEEELKVPFGTRKECIWEYNVIWVSKDKGIEHILDPKIAVEPVIPFTKFIAFLLLLLTSLFFIKSFRKTIRKR